MYSTQITELRDKKGDSIPLTKMENIEIGKNHTSISDNRGVVYSVGLNTSRRTWNSRQCK